MIKNLEFVNISSLRRSRLLDFYYDLSSFVFLGFLAGLFNHLIDNSSMEGKKINDFINQFISLDIFIYLASTPIAGLVLLHLLSSIKLVSFNARDGFIYRFLSSLFSLGVVSGVGSSLFLYSFSIGALCYGYWSGINSQINAALSLSLTSTWFLLLSLVFVNIRSLVIGDDDDDDINKLLWLFVVSVFCYFNLGYVDKNKIVEACFLSQAFACLLAVLCSKCRCFYLYRDIDRIGSKFAEISNNSCMPDSVYRLCKPLILALNGFINLFTKLVSLMIHLRYFLAYLCIASVYSYIYHSTSTFKPDLGWIDSIYLSFVVITTLGFGDILPSGDISKMIVISEVVVGVLLIGIFLNSLSHRVSFNQRERDKKLELVRKERLRNSLEKHLCIILDVFQSGSPFMWSKHAKHTLSMQELGDFIDKIESKDIKCYEVLNVKSLLECAHHNYDNLVALSSVAAEISDKHLMEWGVIINSVRILKDKFEEAEKNINDEFFEWPRINDVSLYVEEMINAGKFIADKQRVSTP